MMIVIWLLLLLSLLSQVATKVCIVGAGIGGTSTAAFLREFDPSLSIVILERRSDVGGRLKTIKIDGVERPIDAGGSIIHKDNRYIIQFAKQLGLTIQSPAGGSWGIYDGSKFVFESGASEALDAGKLFMKYGMSLTTMQDLTKKMLEKFLQIYDLQTKGMMFATPKELLDKLDLYDLTQLSLAEMMVKQKVNKNLINELMAAVMRVNYGQNCTLNALAGMISLAGAGSDTRVVQNGFQEIPKGLIRLTQAQVILNVTVTEILKAEEEYIVKGTPNLETSCEAVVIAAPLEQSSIQLPSGISPPEHRQFQLTQTTFIRGRTKASFFGKKRKQASAPCKIYTTEHPNNAFNAIGCYNGDSSTALLRLLRRFLFWSSETKDVYKVFSREKLTQKWIESVFEDAEVLLSIPWKAYPHFSPPEKFAPFVLSPGLVYIDTIESGASAMEVSAVGAKNAALLVYSWLKQQRGAQSENEKTEL